MRHATARTAARTALVVLTVVLVAGCGADEPEPQGAEAAEPAPLTLTEACEQVEALVPARPSRVDGDQPEWASAADELRQLSDEGDEDVESALAPLVAAAEEMSTVDSDPVAEDGEVVLPYLEAEEALDTAIGDLRRDCADVGIPVFE